MTNPQRFGSSKIATGADLNRLLELIIQAQLRPSSSIDVIPAAGGTTIEVRDKSLPGFVTLGGCDQLGRPITIKVAAKGPPTLV